MGFEFIGHYNEPNLELVYELYSRNEEGSYALEYNPQNGLRDGTLLLRAIDVGPQLRRIGLLDLY